jgi:hypothetical protein
MRYYFKKGYDKTKPKRWVLVYRNISEGFTQPVFSTWDTHVILTKFREKDFKPSKISYAGHCKIYFYFRSYAEEARFLLTYSDHIDKGFDDKDFRI